MHEHVHMGLACIMALQHANTHNHCCHHDDDDVALRSSDCARTRLTPHCAMSAPKKEKDEVNKVLNSGLGLLNQWTQVEQILLSNGLAYQKEFPPALFLVHPSNREQGWVWNKWLQLPFQGCLDL